MIISVCCCINHPPLLFVLISSSSPLYNQMANIIILPPSTTFMHLPLFFLLLLVDTAFSSNIFVLSQQQHANYAQWKSNYGKSYQSGEVEAYRLTLWVQNFNKIQLHNAKYQDGTVSYYLASNHLSDLPFDEIEDSLFYDSIDSYDSSDSDDSLSSGESVCSQASIDEDPLQSKFHTYQGTQLSQFAITPAAAVCANGWAMAVSQTVSVSLSNLARSMKKSQIIITLSPQQLTDCALTGLQLNAGCSKGSLASSWRYYMTNGAVLNAIYPQTYSARVCNIAITQNPSFRISGCKTVVSSSQFELRKAVSVTPVAVEINAKAFGFIYYGGGIYDASDCDQESYSPNHALTVIGFDYQLDFDENGLMRNTAYWQMMNSLGSGWGENGYIRIARGEGETGPGPCGMYKNPTYPVL